MNRKILNAKWSAHCGSRPSACRKSRAKGRWWTSGIALVLGVASGHSVYAEVTPKDLVEVIDISNLALSHDEKWVAYRREQAQVDSNTIISAWYVASLNGEGVKRVADGGWPLRDSAGQSIIEPPQWSADGHVLYFRAVFDGKIEVWRVDVTRGAAAEQVTQAGADVRSFQLRPDGKTMVVSYEATRAEIAQAEASQYKGGVHLDASVPIGQPLFRSSLTVGKPSTVRYSGAWMDRGRLLADRPPVRRIIDLKSKQDIESAPIADKAGGGMTAFPDEIMGVTSAKGRRAAIVAQSDPHTISSGRQTALVVSDNKGGLIRCNNPACRKGSLEWLVWQPDGLAIIFAVRDYEQANAQTVYRWSPDRGRMERLAQSGGLLNGGRSPDAPCTVGNQVVVCVEAAPASPPRLVAMRFNAEPWQTLDAPNASRAAGWRINVERRVWHADNGQTFSGFYYPPTDQSEPAPLFVNYYTCRGFIRGGMGDEWPFAALAAQGIASLCINYPPQSPIDPVARFALAPAAISAIVHDLAKEGRVDPCRVGMGGLSFGSEVTYWTLMHTDLLAAASVTSTEISPLYYWFRGFRDQAFRDELRHTWGLGAPDETPEQWKVISPAFNVERLRTPLLVQASEQEYLEMLDFLVPAIHAGAPVDIYVFADEPHIKFQPAHQFAAFQRNIDWFRYWLLGESDPDPNKTDQYTHWANLRSKGRTGEPMVSPVCPGQ